jgi:hypothetical protein
MKKLIIATALVAASTVAFAGSLTTAYNYNSGLVGNGSTIFMDLNVTSGITVTSLDVNIGNSTPVSLNVFARTGTASGFEQNPTGWTLVSSGTGTGAGSDNPTAVDLTDFTLNPGVTGIAVQYMSGFLNYINGNGTNQLYSNADLSLTAISASNSTVAGFDGATVYSPRVFSGTVYYDAVPEPATLTVLGLAALAATRRKRHV